MAGTSGRHQDNRAAWNEAAEHYAGEIERDVAFLRAGGSNLQPAELRTLPPLAGWCNRALHLQCAGGLDTLSLLRHGAETVVGLDISDRMIDCARRKSEALGASAEWHRCDVLEPPASLAGTADLIYTGKGALCWIMDIQAWAYSAERLLRPGGRLYVFEGHPLQWVWDPEAPDLRFDPNPHFGSYFAAEISTDRGWPNEYIPSLSIPNEKQSPKHERQWTLGAILNALTHVRLRLERFEEHPEPYWNQFPNIPIETLHRLPQTFSLLMSKPRP
jgi:SAM-dependent methyltransferase